VLCSVVQCGAVLCSVVQCGAVLCSVVQCGAVLCSAVQCGAMWCHVVPCGAVQCSMLQCGSVPIDGADIIEICRVIRSPKISSPPPFVSHWTLQRFLHMSKSWATPQAVVRLRLRHLFGRVGPGRGKWGRQNRRSRRLWTGMVVLLERLVRLQHQQSRNCRRSRRVWSGMAVWLEGMVRLWYREEQHRQHRV